MSPWCITLHGHGSSGNSCLTPLLGPGLACVVRLARPSARQHHSLRPKSPPAPYPASLPRSPSEGQCQSPAWCIDQVTYLVRSSSYIQQSMRLWALLRPQVQTDESYINVSSSPMSGSAVWPPTARMLTLLSKHSVCGWSCGCKPTG